MKITVKKGVGEGESALEEVITKLFSGHSALGFQWCHAFLDLLFFPLSHRNYFISK